MKQKLATAIDFYLQTQKINPFNLHIGSNASSPQLVQLRNNAYILNKLSLLHLQPISQQYNSQKFLQQYCQLYASTLQAVINNPMMPYKDFDSVKDLVYKVEHYHKILSKLTISKEGISQQTYKIKRKLSLNSFWPRIRALLIGMEQKVPNNYPHIRQFIIIRRGLMEPDKQYFVAQMMAKKIQTFQLQYLIKKYAKKQQQNDQHNNEISLSEGKSQNNIQSEIQNQSINIDWLEAKDCARMICFTNQLSDWKKLYSYLNSQGFNSQLSETQKQNQLEYLRQILQQIKQKQLNKQRNQQITMQNQNNQEQNKQKQNNINPINLESNQIIKIINLIYKNH